MQIRIANIIRGTLIGNTMSVLTRYISRVVNGGGIVEKPQCVETAINSQSILQQASLLVVPSGYKGGTLYSEIPTNGNGDLTWTRGSDAFRTNASGVLQRVPWNLLQYSEDFSNGVYTKVATTITSNTTNAPNGTLTADKLVSTSVSSSHSVYQNLGSVGDTRVISCFVKKAEYRYVNIQYGTASVRFDFDTLTFSGGTSNSYTDEGGGWYRISSLLTATVNARVTILIPDNSGNVTYTGDDVSGTFIWGFQAVEGTTAQTYLPTTDRLNFPRLSYMYGSCPSALLEPQRTNIALWSQDFDNASWYKSVATITANTITSPDGSSNADKITASAGNANHGIFNVSPGYTVASLVPYAYSCYAKKGNVDYLIIDHFQGSNAFTWFNINDGTIGTTASGVTASIQSVGNGWYRCTCVKTITNTSSNYIGLYLSNANSTIQFNATGNEFIYLFGAQVEAGAYPTTYIPTTSATATRVADSFSRNNIYTNGLISASGGTWFVELRGNLSYVRDGIFRLGIGNTTALTTDSLYISGGFNTRNGIYKTVSASSSLLYNTTTDTTKIAIKWNGTTADIFANGTKVVTATSFTTTNMENLVSTGVGVPTFIQQMALFPTPLSDTDCELLTGTAYSSYESMATALGYYVI